MSEYWVSKKKYYCKYCEIYISDDAPSRQQHENGLRHQGNKSRFIRDIYKSGERKKKDLEEEKREMKRVEQAAQAAYAKDVGSGAVASTSSSSPLPPPPQPKKPPAKPTDVWQNYSTAASLGYTDVDNDRRVAEAEMRRSEGRIGEWNTVASPFPQPPRGVPVVQEEKAEPEVKVEHVPRYLGNKTVGDGLRELYDPGVIKVKAKPEEEATVLKREDEASGSGLPRWTSQGWTKAVKKVEEVKPEVPSEEVKAEESDTAATVEEPAPPVLTEEDNQATEPPSVETGLFKKRKAASSTAGARGVRRKL